MCPRPGRCHRHRPRHAGVPTAEAGQGTPQTPDTKGETPCECFPGYGLGFHSTPHVGDAIVFNYNGNGYADHVALVTQVNSNGTIYSIGGNERGGSGIVASDGAYSSAIGYSSYWGMNISGYVSP